MKEAQTAEGRKLESWLGICGEREKAPAKTCCPENAIPLLPCLARSSICQIPAFAPFSRLCPPTRAALGSAQGPQDGTPLRPSRASVESGWRAPLVAGLGLRWTCSRRVRPWSAQQPSISWSLFFVLFPLPPGSAAHAECRPCPCKPHALPSLPVLKQILLPAGPVTMCSVGPSSACFSRFPALCVLLFLVSSAARFPCDARRDTTSRC